jgi:hypothetical protein
VNIRLPRIPRRSAGLQHLQRKSVDSGCGADVRTHPNILNGWVFPCQAVNDPALCREAQQARAELHSCLPACMLTKVYLDEPIDGPFDFLIVAEHKAITYRFFYFTANKNPSLLPNFLIRSL